MFAIESLGAGTTGMLMRGNGQANLRDVPFDTVVDVFRESGALLFRDFGAAATEFAAFTDRFSSETLPRVHVKQNRRGVAENEDTSTVDLGQQHIGPHAELAYSPRRPDLLWFYCACPPASGGETTLFDGIEIWKRLPDPVRDKFATTELRYSFEAADENVWPLLTGELADRDRTLEILAPEPEVSCVPRDDDTIDITCRMSAAKPSRYQGAPAFANGIIPNGSDVVSFADGTPLPSSTRLAIMSTCDDLMTRLDWRKGDIIMIDNSRMMHGRLPFSDPAREIHIRMSKAAF